MKIVSLERARKERFPLGVVLLILWLLLWFSFDRRDEYAGLFSQNNPRNLTVTFLK